MSEETASVVIDVPRGSFVKRRDDGTIDFVAPLPSPFNYGHVPGTVSDDGDAIDAVVLGPRLPRGTRTDVVIRGTIGFIDAGATDPKWICCDRPLGLGDRRRVEGFFRRYAVAKRLINRLRGVRGPTRYLGWL
ncbi:MAG: inorganic diphosphatase [Polyangiales bacterium]|jgi:inorganic pyrophosphatase